eukprot:g21546.t1
MACRLLSFGLELDVFSLNSAISAGGEWQQALQLLNRAEDQELTDVISYNVAMKVCELLGWIGFPLTYHRRPLALTWEASYWEAALQLMSSMEQSMLEANLIIYNSAMSAGSKAEEWQEVLQLMEDMCERSIEA